MKLVFAIALVFCCTLPANGKGFLPKMGLQTRLLADLLEETENVNDSAIAGESQDLDRLPNVDITEDSSGGKII